MAAREYLVLLLPIIAGGCAALPQSIKPTDVAEAPYDAWTCPQIIQEQATITSDLASASQQQNEAHTADHMGVILLGLPLGSMSGDDVAPKIALYKGQQIALQKASDHNRCGGSTSSMPASPAS